MLASLELDPSREILYDDVAVVVELYPTAKCVSISV